MIQETGVVEKIDEEFAYIRAARSGTCSGCASKSMCSPDDGKEYVIVQAINKLGAEEGDTVKFEVPASSFLKASILVYAVPLIALLIGTIVGKKLHPLFSESFSKDGLSALSALIFVIISVFVVKIAGKGTENEKYYPKIVEIIG